MVDQSGSCWLRVGAVVVAVALVSVTTRARADEPPPAAPPPAAVEETPAAAPAAAAEEPPAPAAEPAGPTTLLDDAAFNERYKLIDGKLREATDDTWTWWTAWMIGLGALVVGQGIWAGVTDDAATREDRAAGAVTSGLGIVTLLIKPPPGDDGVDGLPALPQDTAEERAAKLAAAEKHFEWMADREARGVSWLPHVLTTVLALTQGAVLWAGYGRLKSGVLGFLGTMAIGEARILTQPTVAADAWDAYRGKYKLMPRTALQLSPSLIPTADGVTAGVVGRF